MKFPDQYFEPYAEYCIRTSFTEDELRKILKAELSSSRELFSGMKAYWGMEKNTVFLLCPGENLKLAPARYGRNTLRGNLFIRCEKAVRSGETILHIKIAPEKSGKYLIYTLWLFAIFFGILTVVKVWWVSIFILLQILFSFAVLAGCRNMGEEESIKIRQDFEMLLRQLEKKHSGKS